MKSPTFICLCHDVTVEDVDRAVEQGFDHPETIKRFTAAMMGPCQGRWCASLLLDAIRERGAEPPEEVVRPTSRPPVFGLRMGHLAGGDGEDRRARRGDGGRG